MKVRFDDALETHLEHFAPSLSSFSKFNFSRKTRVRSLASVSPLCAFFNTVAAIFKLIFRMLDVTQRSEKKERYYGEFLSRWRKFSTATTQQLLRKYDRVT